MLQPRIAVIYNSYGQTHGGVPFIRGHGRYREPNSLGARVAILNSLMGLEQAFFKGIEPMKKV